MCPVDTYGSSTNAGSCSNCPSLTNTQGQTGQTSVNACSKFSLPITHIVLFAFTNFHWRIQGIGSARGTRSLLVQFFFNFLQFTESRIRIKITKIIAWLPHLWGWHPRLGNLESATVSNTICYITPILWLHLI